MACAGAPTFRARFVTISHSGLGLRGRALREGEARVQLLAGEQARDVFVRVHGRVLDGHALAADPGHDLVRGVDLGLGQVVAAQLQGVLPREHDERLPALRDGAVCHLRKVDDAAALRRGKLARRHARGERLPLLKELLLLQRLARRLLLQGRLQRAQLVLLERLALAAGLVVAIVVLHLVLAQVDVQLHLLQRQGVVRLQVGELLVDLRDALALGLHVQAQQDLARPDLLPELHADLLDLPALRQEKLRGFRHDKGIVGAPLGDLPADDGLGIHAHADRLQELRRGPGLGRAAEEPQRQQPERQRARRSLLSHFRITASPSSSPDRISTNPPASNPVSTSAMARRPFSSCT